MSQSFRKEEQFYMKEMEWGVNSKTNTTYMNYEFDIDSLYSTIVKMDYLVRVNPHLDINLNIASYGGDVYSMLGLVDYIKNLPNVSKHTLYRNLYERPPVLLMAVQATRTMSKNVNQLVHEGSNNGGYVKTSMVKGVDHLKKLQVNINKLTEVTNKDERFWELTQRNDTYFNDFRRVFKYGIIDKII